MLKQKTDNNEIAWQINHDCKISDKSRRNFDFLPHLNLLYLTDIHQVFTWCRGISATIIACIYMALWHSVSASQSKEWRCQT